MNWLSMPLVHSNMIYCNLLHTISTYINQDSGVLATIQVHNITLHVSVLFNVSFGVINTRAKMNNEAEDYQQPRFQK